MQHRIMVVDDSPLIIDTIDSFLKEANYLTGVFTSPKNALEELQNVNYDCILSDFFMPEMNGDQFFREIKLIKENIPFVFMSTNEDIRIAIELMKMGADDYITKPIIKDALIFRIDKTLKEYDNRKIIERVEKEQEIREYEEKQLVNWRNLYASKDIKQTEQFIKLFSHSYTQSGVFLLIDMFRNQIEKIDDDYFKIGSHLAKLLIDAGEKQEREFDQINLINQIDVISISDESFDYEGIKDLLQKLFDSSIQPGARKYSRIATFFETNFKFSGNVTVDGHYLKKILMEMLWNAVKYSPENTEINLFCTIERSSDSRNLAICMRNSPRSCSSADINGKQIIGIPLEYSELVFDLFYRMDESFPLDDEEWTGGVGLYAARRILRRQNCWITAHNGIDYTEGAAEPFVQVSVALPLKI